MNLDVVRDFHWLWRNPNIIVHTSHIIVQTSYIIHFERGAKVFQDYILKGVQKKVFKKIICGKKGLSPRSTYFCRPFSKKWNFHQRFVNLSTFHRTSRSSRIETPMGMRSAVHWRCDTIWNSSGTMFTCYFLQNIQRNSKRYLAQAIS